MDGLEESSLSPDVSLHVQQAPSNLGSPNARPDGTQLAGANVVTQTQTRYLGLEREELGRSSSNFSQRIFSVGFKQGLDVHFRATELDPAQGPPKRLRGLSSDYSGNEDVRSKLGFAGDAGGTAYSGLRRFLRPGTANWPMLDVGGSTSPGGVKRENSVVASGDDIVGDSAGTVKDSGTGSSGLEQRSATATLATSGSFGFMGGSAGLGMSGSGGRDGGRSGSNRSSGLSEVEGVAPGFMFGRGSLFSGGGSRHGLGQGSGIVSSHGFGSEQVLKLWGLRPNGVPRARAVAMAGAGTFAAAGRGRAYAFNCRKPTRTFQRLGEEGQVAGDLQETRVIQTNPAGKENEAQPNSSMLVDGVQSANDHQDTLDQAPQQEYKESAQAIYLETSQPLEQAVERQQELLTGFQGEGRRSAKGRKRHWLEQVAQDLVTDVEIETEDAHINPSVSTSHLQDVHVNPVGRLSEREESAAFKKRIDEVTPSFPGNRLAVDAHLQAEIPPLDPKVTNSAAAGSVSLETGPRGSALPTSGSSRGGKDQETFPSHFANLSTSSTPIGEDVRALASVQPSVSTCGVRNRNPLKSARSVWTCDHYFDTEPTADNGILGVAEVSGSGKAQMTAFEGGNSLSSRCGRLDNDIGTTIERPLSSHVDTDEKDQPEALAGSGAILENEELKQKSTLTNFSMSRRESGSADERRRLNQAELTYRRKLEEEEIERQRERRKETGIFIHGMRGREYATGWQDGISGRCDKKQRVGEVNNGMHWNKVEATEGNTAIIPPSRPGAGSFGKWLWDVGKGKSLRTSTDCSVPSGLPGDALQMRRLPLNVKVVSSARISTSCDMTGPGNCPKGSATEPDIACGDIYKASQLALESHRRGSLTIGGLGTQANADGQKEDELDRQEYFKHASKVSGRSMSSSLLHVVRSDSSFVDDLRAEPSSRRHLSQINDDSAAPEDGFLRSQVRDRDKDDGKESVGRTRLSEVPNVTFPDSDHRRPSTMTTFQGLKQIQRLDPSDASQFTQGKVTKCSPYGSVAEGPLEASPGLVGGVDTNKSIPYKDSKVARDMWMCRFSPKVGIGSANIELQQQGSLITSPIKQTQRHRSSQVVSREAFCTERNDLAVFGAEVNVKPDGITQGFDQVQTGELNHENIVSDGLRHGSLYEGDGSGEIPQGHKTMDYAASMNAVKAWRIESGKHIEKEDNQFSTGKYRHCRCWFCGLPGHKVAQCSETLDCELRDLMKRAKEYGEIVSGGEILCLRCLSTGHWGAQCRLTVKEASSRAHEKAESWMQLKIHWLGNCGGKERERDQGKQRESPSGHYNAQNFLKQDPANVVCFNCNERGHWARYCPRRRSCSGGGQSSSSSKGQQSASSSEEKLHPPRLKNAVHACVTCSEKSGDGQGEPRFSRICEKEHTLEIRASKGQPQEALRSQAERSRRRGKVKEVSYCYSSDKIAIELNSIPDDVVLNLKSESHDQNSKIGLGSGEKVEIDHSPRSRALALKNHPVLSVARPMLPPIPRGMFAALEHIRLSRPDLQKWVDSLEFGKIVEGFFLRLRFGRWESQLGGTGYRMARIKEAAKKAGSVKAMVISVDLGESECTVDGQYVSNQPFAEAEIEEWCRGAWQRGGHLLSDTEIAKKMTERRRWP